MEVIKKHIDELKALCEKHKIKELYVFGSAAKDFLKSDSDIDFLVTFGEVKLQDYFDNYINFKESLEMLFQREVDLVETQTVQNPILKESIDKDKRLVYGQTDSEMAL